MLLVFCIYASLLIIFANNGRKGLEEIQGSVRALITYFLVATVAILGFVSVLLLRRMQVALLGIKLVTLLSYLRIQKGIRAFSAISIKRVNAPLGLLYGIFGSVLILASILPDELLKASDSLRISNRMGFLAFFLLLRARRYLQVNADSLLSVDKRPMILFLRSFSDEWKKKYHISDIPLLDYTLETRLSNHFIHFGPFIALGSPREAVPELGAARVILSDNEWQLRLMHWISEASLIIIYSGKTRWVNWELAKVIEMERAPNLILMLPEIKGQIYTDQTEELTARIEDLSIRIEHVKQVFKNTIWSESLAAFRELQNARAILFGTDGSLIVIKSRPRNRNSYHLAAIIAHYILLKSAVLS